MNETAAHRELAITESTRSAPAARPTGATTCTACRATLAVPGLEPRRRDATGQTRRNRSIRHRRRL